MICHVSSVAVVFDALLTKLIIELFIPFHVCSAKCSVADIKN